MLGKKRIIALVATLSILGATGSVYAADGDFKTPAEILGGLTGKTATEVTAEQEPGTTYGTIAQEAGVFDSFKAEMIDQKKALLKQRVDEGVLTQQDAETILQRMETNQATCDGTGGARIGQGNGARMGQGKMMEQRQGMRAGMGIGMNGQGYAQRVQ